jgi:hypothetical protein
MCHSGVRNKDSHCWPTSRMFECLATWRSRMADEGKLSASTAWDRIDDKAAKTRAQWLRLLLSPATADPFQKGQPLP